MLGGQFCPKKKEPSTGTSCVPHIKRANFSLQVMSSFFSNLINFFIYVGPTKEILNKHPPVLVNILLWKILNFCNHTPKKNLWRQLQVFFKKLKLKKKKRKRREERTLWNFSKEKWIKIEKKKDKKENYVCFYLFILNVVLEQNKIPFSLFHFLVSTLKSGPKNKIHFPVYSFPNPNSHSLAPAIPSRTHS